MKKVGFLGLGVIAALLFALAFPAAAGSPKTATPAPPVVVAAPAAPAVAAMPGRHPHIDEALEHMRVAKHELETAAHEFKGHRVKSIEHLDQAIHEAEECLRAD